MPSTLSSPTLTSNPLGVSITGNTNINQTNSNIHHMKILVPAAAAGRIIGKGGTTIEQLQKDAGARVKMSKASEFYPGTTERVCLISGPLSGILKINNFFLDNLSSNLIKILVPNSTAGMIIGKGGSYIKEIKEKSGAYVQISQKSNDISFPERCVTVIGEQENIRKACEMILCKIVEDVGSGNFLNINYRESKQQQQQDQQLQLQSLTNNPSSTAITTHEQHNTNSAQMIYSIKTILQVSGYGEDEVSEITSAMSILANYGVLGIGLGLL